MLSSRTGVHGQLVAKRVEEASEAGTESVHRRVTFHALTILQKRKTVTQMPALQTVRNVTPVRMNFAVKLCRVVGPVIIDTMFFLFSDEMLRLQREKEQRLHEDRNM